MYVYYAVVLVPGDPNVETCMRARVCVYTVPSYWCLQLAWKPE